MKATVMEDNTSTIHIANRGEGHNGKSKHFRVRHHFVKDLIENATITIKHCDSNNMIADFLTKPMIGQEFRRQVNRAMRNNMNL